MIDMVAAADQLQLPIMRFLVCHLQLHMLPVTSICTNDITKSKLVLVRSMHKDHGAFLSLQCLKQPRRLGGWGQADMVNIERHQDIWLAGRSTVWATWRPCSPTRAAFRPSTQTA